MQDGWGEGSRTLFEGAGGVLVRWHTFCLEADVERRAGREKLEICVNFEGRGEMRERGQTSALLPETAGWHLCNVRSRSWRAGGDAHRFVTLEIPKDWLAGTMGPARESCGITLRNVLEGKPENRLGRTKLTAPVRQAAEEMIRPPVPEGLQAVWYPAKVIEVVAHVFAAGDGELFCERQHKLARERVAAVKAILQRDLENPRGLAEIAKEVGCSPFYLSRIFSEETGSTITRYLRRKRLDLAAERLRSGAFNVTEAAMSVGYSSLSHFSKAFAGQFGHCPCVFPLQGGGTADGGTTPRRSGSRRGS